MSSVLIDSVFLLSQFTLKLLMVISQSVLHGVNGPICLFNSQLSALSTTTMFSDYYQQVP